MPIPVACEVCGDALAQNRTGMPRKYCPLPKRCTIIAKERRKAIERGEQVAEGQDRKVVRKGQSMPEEQRWLVYRDWPSAPDHLAGKLANREVARVFSVDARTAGRWKKQLEDEKRGEVHAARFKLDAEAQEMLEPTVTAFLKFYRWLMPGTTRQPLRLAKFHREWAQALLDAYNSGGRTAIQSPQRFGKTQMCVAFMVWLILRDPDVRIMFVARTKDKAEKSTGHIRRLLADSGRVASRFLPAGASFVPPKLSGLSWTDGDLTVATRKSVLASPTVVAVGAGGTILGADVDFLFSDDLEDFRNAQSPTQREQLKAWFTADLQSRKEEHTGWVYIGSCQHPEDLLSMLRRDKQWKVLTYSAHDRACMKELWVPSIADESEPANPEDHVDCLLWPEVRTYRWLYKSRQSAWDPKAWDMNMLGVMADGGAQTFPQEMVETALDWGWTLGQVKPEWRLVAGLDPGGGGKHGHMGAVLWGVDVATDVRTVVDVLSMQSGGLAAIRDVFHAWHRDYGLREWVVEMNLAQAYLYDDTTLSELRQRHQISVVEHYTSSNKLDQLVGVPSLREHFTAGRFKFPYGDERSRKEMDEFMRQWRQFTPGIRQAMSSTYRIDLVMAAWFPEAVIRSWQASQSVETDVQYAESWRDDYAWA